MADNNNDAVVDNDFDDDFDEDFDFEEDDGNVITSVETWTWVADEVETKIERLKSDNPKVTLFCVTFDNFEDLPSGAKQWLVSSEFFCFGNQWRVSIRSGNSLFLERRSEGRNLPAMEYSLSVCSIDGKDRIFSSSSYQYYGRLGGYLADGALVVRVSMQLDHEENFVPKNPASSIILKLFNDEKSADVVFEIDDDQKQSENRKSNGRMRAKTSTAKLYHAHRLILQHHSPELSALCATSDDMTPIIINDIKPEVFRHLLYYVYGGEISEEDFVGHERDLINAADKYGVTNLKLEAEGWYVNNTDITIDNVIETLLYAHAMNCALIKESVMDIIVENKETIFQQEQVSFQDVPGDVFKELLAAVSRHYDKGSTSDDAESEKDVEKTYMKMRICDLRQELQDKGLDIDGSREALIAKLKEHS